MSLADGIFLGTSSFTAPGWQGTFYPIGLKPADRLSFYADRFDTVEIDSTFYGIPRPQAVHEWRRKTPDLFRFSVKVPQVITHERVLAGCEADFTLFLETMDQLGPKLGPIVFQFPYFDRSAFHTAQGFLDRLRAFLPQLPSGRQFAVEICNKNWFTADFADLLREHRVALVLADRPNAPRPPELFQAFDPITADWTYIRWLGDRKGLEQITKSFDRIVVDRKEDLRGWVDVCYQIKRRGVLIYAYANNHYAGHAPSTIAQFRDLWYACGLPKLERAAELQPPEVTTPPRSQPAAEPAVAQPRSGESRSMQPSLFDDPTPP